MRAGQSIPAPRLRPQPESRNVRSRTPPQVWLNAFDGRCSPPLYLISNRAQSADPRTDPLLYLRIAHGALKSDGGRELPAERAEWRLSSRASAPSELVNSGERWYSNNWTQADLDGDDRHLSRARLHSVENPQNHTQALGMLPHRAGT